MVCECFNHTVVADGTVIQFVKMCLMIAGELVPVYKAELINAFLSGTKDDDFLVRASSLSNLGELSRLLGFRVGPIVTEVRLGALSVSNKLFLQLKFYQLTVLQ